MTIFVAKRKSDQYREGHTSYLARSGSLHVQLVLLIKKILRVLPQLSESFPLVRRIVKPGNAFTLMGCVCVYSKKRIQEVY